jgi:diacylglycerol kinase family enzyme
MSGKVLTLKQASETSFEKISIDCEKPFTIDVDGELYQNVKFDVEIVSDKLKMYR